MTSDIRVLFTRLPEVLREQQPYPFLARLRQASPYLASDGVVVVAKHDHCTAILRDPRTSSDRRRARIFREDARPSSRKLVDLDPPDHTRIRRLVSRSFTARATAPLVPLIRATVNDLLDAVPAGGPFDAVGDLASPLALSTVCTQLGVPAADHELVGGWSRTLSRGLYPLPLGSVDQEATRNAARAGARIHMYFKKLISGPRPTPPGPVLADLLRAEEQETQLSENEVLGVCALLVNAGYETTVDLIGNGIRALLDHPDQLKRLADDPDLAPAVVDEVLRYDSPAQITTRVATTDLSVGGLRIAAGDLLVLLLGAANRDPAVFSRPDEFDISRPEPVQHLAFAAGPHFCLGGGLARIEGAAAFAAFAGRVVEPKLVSDRVTYKPTPSLRGPESLGVAFGGVRAAPPGADASDGRSPSRPRKETSVTGVTTADSVARVFQERVREHGDREAVALVRDPDDPSATESWTYRRLHDEASAVAAHLGQLSRPGDRILLTYPSGPHFAAAFLGCLYAGLIAVPAPLPVRSGQQKRRLTAIANDAGASVVLAHSNDRDVVAEWLSSEELTGIAPVFTDTLEPAPADEFSVPECGPDTIAFLQYTSGSTGDAKGVVLTHDNILTNSRILFEITALPPEEIRLVCWLPLYHDMGLIGQLLSPLLFGGTSFLLDPGTFVRRPYSWLRTIDRYRATVSAAPDFAFRLCVERITDEEVARLDLSSWKTVTNGADWLNLSTMRRFIDRFSAAGFQAELCPAYGLAEATLIVASRRAPALRVLDADRNTLDGGAFEAAESAEVTKQIVSCGSPHEIDLELVDPDTLDTLPEDQVGEIWLRGRSVAKGYWGRADQTRQMFHATTARGDGPYLRTGDLGFRHDGELYVTGRIKEVIVVRGLKIYPQDIESALRAEFPELSGIAAAFRLPGAEDEPDRVVITHEVRAASTERLPELAQGVVHLVAREFGAQVAAVLFLRQGQVQRTTSGKVKRVEMRERYLAGALQPIYQHTR